MVSPREVRAALNAVRLAVLLVAVLAVLRIALLFFGSES